MNKKWCAWGLGLALFLASCDKSDNSSYTLNGRYTGIFNRTGMDTAQVSVIFNGNRFTGSSNRPNYPAICNGEFKLGDHAIVFNDSCTWKADFDWSMILSGKYNISLMDGAVRIWKTNGTITDEYLLRQPTISQKLSY